MPHGERLSAAIEPPDRDADCVIHVDHDWRVTGIDANARERVGMGDESLGRDIRDLFPLSAATYARDVLQRALEEGEESRLRFYGRELGTWFDMRMRPVEGGAEIAFRDLADDGAAGDEPPPPTTDDALNRIAEEMRRLADRISQGRLSEPDGDVRLPGQQWNDGRLARIAEAIYRDRRNRAKVLGVEFGEPQWDILLDLFIQAVRSNRVSVTSACIAADVPPSTALRALDQLAGAGMVARKEDVEDRRRVWVSLTPKGIRAMRSFLRNSELAALQSQS